MKYKGTERRTCARFSIPGATVNYKKRPHLLAKEEYCEEDYPVLNISRGGITFLSQEQLSIDSTIVIKIYIPDENYDLLVMGRVKWASLSPGMSYKFQIGIQFNPYGKKKEHNSPDVLDKIIALEQKYLKLD